MKILQEENKFQLVWEYSIQSNKTLKKDKEYYFYNAVFPSELVHYYNTPQELWIYQHHGRTYITNQEPPYTKARRIRLFTKGNQNSKDITLSKKFFTELTGNVKGKIRYIFHLDEHDPLSSERGIVEVCIHLSSPLTTQ